MRMCENLIPSRVLTESAISVILLNLNPDAATEWNHHPGFESAIPLQGTVEVRFWRIRRTRTEAPAV